MLLYIVVNIDIQTFNPFPTGSTGVDLRKILIITIFFLLEAGGTDKKH